MFLIALTLFAPQADACSYAMTDVLQVAPADGATAVPIDARMRIRAGDEQTNWEEPVIRLFRERSEVDGAALVSWEEWEWGGSQMAELRPDTELEANTTYELVLEQLDGTIISSSTFTTGTARASSLPAPELVIDSVVNAPMPRVNVNSCDWDHRNISLSLTPLAEPASDLSVIKLWSVDASAEGIPDRTADHSYVVGAGSTATIEAFLSESLPENRRAEECFVAAHEDAAGNLSDATELICSGVTGTDRGGCSTSGSPVGWLPGLLGLMLLRRRSMVA